MNRFFLFLLNAITFSRLPVAFTPLLSLPSPWLFYFCVWAAFSDYFDGLLARKLNLKTEFGAELDQIADKVFHLCLIIYLWHMQICHTTFIAAFVIREMLVVVLRKLAILNKSSNTLGKLKTAFTYALIIYAVFVTTVLSSTWLWFNESIAALEVLILVFSYTALINGFRTK